MARTAERVLLLAGQGGQPSGQTQASIWRSILERRGADVVEARVATRGRRPRFEPTEHFTVVVSSCASLSITRKKLSQCGVAAELYDGARIVDGGRWWSEISKLASGCTLTQNAMARCELAPPVLKKRKSDSSSSSSSGGNDDGDGDAPSRSARPPQYHPLFNPWSLVPSDFAAGGRAEMPCCRPSIMDNPNPKLCMMVKELLSMVKHSPEDQILTSSGTYRSQVKVTAYGRLLSALRAWPKRLTLENVHEFKQVKYVGSSGYLKIKEGLEDMRDNPEKNFPTCSKLEMFRNHPDSHLTRIARELTKVHGIGRSTALRWFKDYGIENLEQLRHAATTRETPSGRRFEAGSDSVRSGNSAGDNHPMSPNTRVCLEHLDEILEPMSFQERNYFLQLLPRSFMGLRLKHVVVGGMRRVKPGLPCNKHHDLDVLISLDEAHESVTEEIAAKFKPRECMDALLADLESHVVFNLSTNAGQSQRKWDVEQHHVRLLLMRNLEGKARRVDLVVVPPRHWAYALLGWSGSTQFERSIKDFTKNVYKGPRGDTRHNLIENNLRYYLSNSMLALVSKRQNQEVEEYDIVQRYDHCKTERDIFDMLGLRYLEPWQRCC